MMCLRPKFVKNVFTVLDLSYSVLMPIRWFGVTDVFGGSVRAFNSRVFTAADPVETQLWTWKICQWLTPKL